MRLLSLLLLLSAVTPFKVLCQDYVEAWYLYQVMNDESRDFDSFYCDLMFNEEFVDEALERYRWAKREEVQKLSEEYFTLTQSMDSLEASDGAFAEVALQNFLELGLSDQLEVYRFCLEHNLIGPFTRFANFQTLWTQHMSSEAFQSMILADNNVLGCGCSTKQYARAIENADSIQALRFIKQARRELEMLSWGEIKKSFWSSVALTTDGRILESNSLAELSQDRYQAERDRLDALELLNEESTEFDLEQYSSASLLYNTVQRTNVLTLDKEYAQYIKYPAYSELDSVDLSLIVQKIAPPIFGRDSFYLDTVTNFHYDPIKIRQAEAWLTSEIGDVSGAREIIDFFPNDIVFDWLLDNLDYEQGLLVNRREQLMELIAFKLYLFDKEDDWDSIVEIYHLFHSVASALEVPSLAEFLRQLDPKRQDFFIRHFLRGLSSSDGEFCELARDAMIYSADSQFYRSLVKGYCQRSSSK